MHVPCTMYVRKRGGGGDKLCLYVRACTCTHCMWYAEENESWTCITVHVVEGAHIPV